MKNTRERALLRKLNLPEKLLTFIRTGVVRQKIEEAYALWEDNTARTDAWEAANPEAAKALPWFKAREAWKAAGRPRPQWYEVLKVFDEKGLLRAHNITQQLYCHGTGDSWRARKKKAAQQSR